MLRMWPCWLLLLAAQPAWAGPSEPPYYGPAKRWHGIGFKFGYEDRTEKDGTWRIDAAIHGRGDAIDMALYRAAERAREAGYPYVFLLGGSGSRSPGIDAATVWARPSRDAVPPVGCRSKKVTSCYTADAAEVMRVLGGPNGTQPGVAIADHRDEFGREVFLSGYGTGGIATRVPGGMARSHVMTIVEERRPPVVSAAAVPVATASPVAAVAITRRAVPSAAAAVRFEEAVKANRPVRGREPTLGWTISN